MLPGLSVILEVGKGDGCWLGSKLYLGGSCEVCWGYDGDDSCSFVVVFRFSDILRSSCCLFFLNSKLLVFEDNSVVQQQHGFQQ